MKTTGVIFEEPAVVTEIDGKKCARYTNQVCDKVGPDSYLIDSQPIEFPVVVADASMLMNGFLVDTAAAQDVLKDSGFRVIELFPGKAILQLLRPSSGRVISVAIFGSKDIDIISINPRTIRLNGVDVMLVGKSDKSLCSSADIDDDGFQDLVCDVRTTGFRVGEGEFNIILKAATYNGESLQGKDRITIEAD